MKFKMDPASAITAISMSLQKTAASVKIPWNEICHLQTFFDVCISLAYG